MPGTSSDTIENLKKAFKSLFRRRKPVGKTPPQVAVPPRLRPRSASATAAPEAVITEASPSWPLANQSPTSGHFHAIPVELPGCLAVNPAFPAWQQRSKSEAAPRMDNSDLFSELDASSVRGESVVGLFTEGEYVQELESPSVDQHIMPRFESQQRSQPELNTAEEETETPQATTTAEAIPDESVEVEEEEIEQEQQQEEPENEPVPQLETQRMKAADQMVAEPEHENEQEKEEEDVSQLGETDMDAEESEEPDHTIVSAISIEDLERNDSANGTVVKDDSSSTYSTVDSAEDDSASDDEGAPSTPRTSSVAQNDSVEYFDEKIPVLSEPPPVFQLTPAPGMAATSGPLEDFSF